LIKGEALKIDIIKLYEEKYKNFTYDINCLDLKKKLLEFLPKKKSFVLDIGSGTGELTSLIRKMRHNVIATEISKNAIKKIKFNHKILSVLINFNENIPFKDKTFDIVFCSEVIEHLFFPENFLKECNRILKNGGLLLLSTPNSVYYIKRILYLLGKTYREVDNLRHIQYFSEKTIRRLVEDAGFEIKKMIGNFGIMIPSFRPPFYKHKFICYLSRWISLLGHNFILRSKK